MGFQIFSFNDKTLFGGMEGPISSFYQNGFFLFKIIHPIDYPLMPPKFYFITKIFHPNIDKDGVVIIDILQEQFSPASIISLIIYSIQSLLDDPNPVGCANVYAGDLYLESRNDYEKTVREYTSRYANFNTVQNELKKLNFEMKLNN